MDFIEQYAYRKEFGLSYGDFLKEPLEFYLVNKEIMAIIAEINRANIRKAERDTKH